MSITLYTGTKQSGTATSFDPRVNVYVFYDGTNLRQQSTFNSDKLFTVKSIKNDTNYVVSLSGPKALVSFFGSVEDTGITDPVYVVGATQIPKKTRGKKNKKRFNAYKITMIVFIVLFAVLFITLLILYFTGMMKFQSFGHGTPY